MRESLRDSASAATESATDVAPDRSRRLGLRGIIVVTVVLILVVGASMRMYLLHRNSNYTEDFGAVDVPDRVNVEVWISHLDTITETLSVEISAVTPSGALAGPDGAFGRDIVLTTSALGAPITIKQHDTGTDTERKFAANGTVTDYPFDRYISVLTFDVTDANGVALPVAVSIWSRDPFFRNTPAAASQAIRRSAR